MAAIKSHKAKKKLASAKAKTKETNQKPKAAPLASAKAKTKETNQKPKAAPLASAKAKTKETNKKPKAALCSDSRIVSRKGNTVADQKIESKKPKRDCDNSPKKPKTVNIKKSQIAGQKRKSVGCDNFNIVTKKQKSTHSDIENKPPKAVGSVSINVKKSKSKNDIKWSIGGKSVDDVPFNFPNTSNYPKNMSAADYFELFFDDTIVDMIVHASSEYCLSKNLPDINLNNAELRSFFGILILSGYNRLPGKPMYWSSDNDLGNEAVAETMRRDRFDNIMRSLHFVSNNNLDHTDKFAKLRPLISHLQRKFMRNFTPTDEAISHDEAMVEYFGNHGCKQAIRDKPIRFSYKVFCQNTPSGYLIAFNPYQCKTFEADEEMEEKFGKSASSLLHIFDSYPLNKSEYPYHFYCDNYFTSIPLLSELKNRGYNCTGTMRADRVGKDCPLMDVKNFKKQPRGYSQVATADHFKNKIFLNRWKDNSAVTVASTCYASNPESSVKRWCRTEKKRIYVPIPHAIHKYNRNMGGTDRTDQNINNYRISIRGKKWWWSLFTWLLDASVQNAWSLARRRNPKLTLLQCPRQPSKRGR